MAFSCRGSADVGMCGSPEPTAAPRSKATSERAGSVAELHALSEAGLTGFWKGTITLFLGFAPFASHIPPRNRFPQAVHTVCHPLLQSRGAVTLQSSSAPERLIPAV